MKRRLVLPTFEEAANLERVVDRVLALPEEFEILVVDDDSPDGTGRIADKYLRRDKPYMVIEATAIDEDGRLLEKLRTYQMKKPDEVGKKWHPQS